MSPSRPQKAADREDLLSGPAAHPRTRRRLPCKARRGAAAKLRLSALRRTIRPAGHLLIRPWPPPCPPKPLPLTATALKPRGIKNDIGQPYNPSYYKRGLQNASDRGGLAVAEYVRGYLCKPPSDGYKTLEDADSLDLACESLVADESKPYACLFSDADRAAARVRLAPHIEAIERRKADQRARIAAATERLKAKGGTAHGSAAAESEAPGLASAHSVKPPLRRGRCWAIESREGGCCDDQGPLED